MRKLIGEIVNSEWTNKLFIKYSFLFRGRKLPLNENLMSFGFDCGNGWYGLIDKLCADIMKVIKNNKKEKWTKDFIVVRVKEKYGGLRFYTNIDNKETEKLIDNAEKCSFKTCEECGDRGKVSRIGLWDYNRCPRCLITLKKQLIDNE